MLTQRNSISYLDGIRGLAAFGVFLNHFSLAFYFAYFSLKPERSHLHGLEMAYSHSLLSFLNNGGYFVAIFFVLSGFVLSRKYFRSDETEVLVSGLHRRFIRLFVPIGFALILSYILMSNHLYSNDVSSNITLSDWFVKQWRFGDIEKRLWNSFTYSTMFSGDASFDTCLWTMSYEFYGSMFVYAFLLFTHHTKKYRLLMMCLAMYYFYVMNLPFYISFVFGMTLNYTEQWIEKRRHVMTNVIAIALFAASLVLGSIPFCSPFPDTWQALIKESSGDYTPWCLPVAAYMLVLAFILSPVMQKIASIKPLKFLGFISFSLYLLHPLLLGSFSSSLFLKLYRGMGYNKAALAVFGATTVVLILASWVMAKYVDQFGIRLAQRVYELTRRPKDSDKNDKAPAKAQQKKALVEQ